MFQEHMKRNIFEKMKKEIGIRQSKEKRKRELQ